ncbi:MAG: DUF2238 domain-containing protein, partial [Erysipelotrichaceae bacterium]|nr:DUF2238 domain-containing protein [Erysipelotrichaceae bacterium]
MRKQEYKEKKLRYFLYICSLLYIITLLYSFYINIKEGNQTAVGMSVVAIFTPLIVPVLFKLFRWKPVYEMYIISTIFMYFASLIGSCLKGYGIIGFDKALHFSSGIFATILAVIFFQLLKKVQRPDNTKDYHVMLVFVNACNIAIAAIWEFYEYAMLIFFQNDAINHYSQGVHDSMTDMLCATLAGLLITLCIIRAYKTGKANFFTNIY